MTRLRRRLLFAGLALASVLLLAWAFQPVRVMGESMEPSLVEGDWLLVARGAPDPQDMVVFVEPGSGKLAVKRVAAVPGERVQLRDGSVLVDGSPRSRVLSGVEDLVPMIDAGGDELAEALVLDGTLFQREDRTWMLPASTEAHAFLRRAPREDYLRRGDHVNGELPATGLGVEVGYRLLTSEARLELVLRKGGTTFIAALDQRGRRLRILREDPGEPQEPLLTVDLDRPHLDGHAFFAFADRGISLILDGELVVNALQYAPPKPLNLSGLPMEFARFEQAGVGGRGPLQILRLRVGRAVLYGSTGTYGVSDELQLADNQYFLLGDNPGQSRDSRHYGAVARDRILGVVSWRAWPGGWTERGWPVD